MAPRQIKSGFPQEAAQLERVAAVESAVKDRLARKRRLITSLMLPSSTVGTEGLPLYGWVGTLV